MKPAWNGRDAVQQNPEWAGLVPGPQLEALHEVADELRRAGVEPLLGGAFAIARHVGRWRGTKDIDFFLRPGERERAIATMLKAGFADYFSELEYDRSWIFRAYRGDALVDLIWTIPNHVTEVDEAWFDHAAYFSLQGREYATVPLEELIWIKLFVLQRDRCDWPDVINLLRCNANRIQWERLLARLGTHEPLLASLLHVLEWISPATILDVPEPMRTRFRLNPKPVLLEPDEEARRVALLDSRPWYAVLVPEKDVMSP